MKLSQFAVDRPIFTTMIALIVILLGAVSLIRLPIDLMPDVTYPTLSIRTNYADAGPEETEELITRPLEEAVSAVPTAEYHPRLQGLCIPSFQERIVAWCRELYIFKHIFSIG